MLSSRHTLLLAFALSVLPTLPGMAAQPFDELLRRVPPGANAIVIMDVERCLSCSMATKEKWHDKRESAYVDRPIILPPEADNIVLAAQLDPMADMEARWELAVMQLHEPIAIRSIARAEGGYVDTVNGLESAWTPSNAYFVKLDDRHLGMMYPANRQFVSRWSTYGTENQEIRISPYLRSAADAFEDSGQIMMAIDLRDMPQEHRIRERLADSPVIPDKLKNDDTLIDDALVDAVTSIQGIVLNVDIDSKARGRMRVDFASDISILKPFAKPLVLEVMDKMGAVIIDFNDWKVTVEDMSIVMEGDLSADGLRRIFSILEVPTAKFSSLSDQTAAPSSSQQPATEEVIGRVSKSYFGSIETLMKDLRSNLKPNNGSHAVWFERYARKIDRLPILNVDEVLLEFGAQVGESFRTIAYARRGASAKRGIQNTATQKAYSSYGTRNYGRYGRSGYGRGYRGGGGTSRTASNQRMTIRAQTDATANKVRYSEWNELENGMAGMRKTMTQKYKIEF